MRITYGVLGLLVAATPVVAQDKQKVRQGPVPAWVEVSAMRPVPESPSGPVFVRRQDLETRLTDHGQEQYIGYRIKVLQSSALELGNIALTWNPAAGAPIVHGIQVFRDGQTIDVLKTAGFEVLRREDQLEAAHLDGMLTAVLRVPDLRVGDEIDVGMTIASRDPTMGSNNAGLLALASTLAPGRYHFGLRWDTARAPHLNVTPDLTAAMTKGAQSVDFRFDDPPFLTTPKNAPPRYMWQRAVQFSDFADWADLARHFAPFYAKAATLPAGSTLKSEAARIAAAHATPMARAAAALKLVQQNVRYIYVGLNGGNLTPASAEETWQRRYGDCKGKTALLLALLAELGVAAEPVLINAQGGDDGIDQRLPIPQLFDHVLVRATIDGTQYWLDGTLPAVAGMNTQLIYPVRWVLPIAAQGRGIERIAWKPASLPDEMSLFEFDARAGFDQPARIVSTQIVRGVKGLQQQMQFAAATPQQLDQAVRQNAIGDTWQTIEDVSWRFDEKTGASILTIKGTGTIDWDQEDGSGRSLALPGGGVSSPERRVRSADQAQDAPYYSSPDYSCHVTTVRLPTATKPPQWSAKPGYDNSLFGRHYYRAWELRDGAIRMVRSSRIEQPEIDAEWAKRDNARIAAFDNSMAWITYTPTGRDGVVGHGERVPATYDMDWSGSEVPCMPAPSSK